MALGLLLIVTVLVHTGTYTCAESALNRTQHVSTGDTKDPDNDRGLCQYPGGDVVEDATCH